MSTYTGPLYGIHYNKAQSISNSPSYAKKIQHFRSIIDVGTT